MKSCGCKHKCTCDDDVMSQNSGCNGTYPGECENPETCPEVFAGACVYYSGDEIVDISIPNGMRINDAIQKIISTLINPGSNYPDSPCQSPIGFYSSKITAATIKLVWLTSGTGVTYQVSYKLVSATTWTINPIVSTLYDTIGGLTANTNYQVKVAAINGSNVCDSLTILIKTKP